MIRFETLTIKGFGVFLEEQEIDLDNRGRVLIVGKNNDTRAANSNGAGKTTIFKALSWVLYGKTVDGLTVDVIHRRAKAAEVSIVFSRGGEAFKITRRRTPKTGKLRLERIKPTAEDMTQTKSAATQEAIDSTIGLDFESFRSVVLFGQGDRSRFASRDLGDAARKAILGRVLALDVYEEARTSAAKERDDISQEIAVIDREIGDVQRQVDEAERKIARLEGILEGLADPATFKAEAKELEQESEALEHLRESTLRKLQEFEKELEELVEDEAKVREIAGRLAKLYGERLEEALREKARLDHLIELKSSATCPTCERPLDDAHEPDPGDIARAEDKWKAAKAKADKANKSNEDAKTTSRELVRDIEGVKADIRTSEREAQRLEDDSEDKRGQAERKRTEAGLVEDRRAEISEEIAGLNTAKKKERIEELRRSVEHLKKRKAIADYWAKFGFGPKGVPAYAIEQALPVINRKANRHLIELADGDLRVRWSATTPGKSGVVKEELTQEVRVEGIDNSVPSGGQQRKIELATELALAEIKSGDKRLPVLLLDEALDGLDSEGQRRVCGWLEGLGADSIFVVSHDPGVAEDFDEVVLVEKTDSASTIKGET